MCGGEQEEYGGYGGCGDGLREGSHAFVFMCMLIYCFYVFRCNGFDYGEGEYGRGECVEEEVKKEEGKNLAVHLLEPSLYFKKTFLMTYKFFPALAFFSV